MKIKRTTHGKDKVRLALLNKSARTHFFTDMCFSIRLVLNNDDAFAKGDNSTVPATDTMKNFAAIHLAHEAEKFESSAAFAYSLASALKNRYDQVVSAEVEVEESKWQRISLDRGINLHSFFQPGLILTPKAVSNGENNLRYSSGFSELKILKTTQSGFSNFHRCDARTLQAGV